MLRACAVPPRASAITTRRTVERLPIARAPRPAPPPDPTSTGSWNPSSRRADDEKDDADDEAAVAVLLRRLAASAGDDARDLASALRRGVNADGVRGLFAARALRAGETVLQVPMSLALVDDPSSRSASPPSSSSSHVPDSWSRQLCRALVRLRRRAERYRGIRINTPFRFPGILHPQPLLHKRCAG